jgi:hypothetical protein
MTASAVPTLPSPVHLVGKSVQCVKSYECDSSDPQQQQQQQQQQSSGNKRISNGTSKKKLCINPISHKHPGYRTDHKI